MKVSALLMMCLLVAWTPTCFPVRKMEAQKSHVNPQYQYPALICTNLHSYSGQAQVGAHSPREQGLCFQDVEHGGSRATSNFSFRKCVFQTKSTDINDYNFLARYTNGNGRGSGIKLCHWNKGGAYLINSLNEIEQTIDQYKPHILGISESNFLSSHNVEDAKINDYNLFFADTLKNPRIEVSRVAVYVHKDVVVKVRNDLMTDSFSSIWLEVGLKRQKRFLVSNVYRDWKFSNQEGGESGSIVSQLSRWESFLLQWENAIATDLEIHVLGDMNLNYLDFHNQSIPSNSHSARLRPLVHALCDLVVPHGFTQLVSEVTRAWTGQESTLLDHHWTNKPEKISSGNAFYHGGSDHKLIFSVRHTKQVVSKPRIIRK